MEIVAEIARLYFPINDAEVCMPWNQLKGGLGDVQDLQDSSASEPSREPRSGISGSTGATGALLLGVARLECYRRS